MSLKFTLKIFQNRIRWRKLSDLAFEFRYFSNDLKIPKPIQKSLRTAMENVLAEAKRWGKSFTHSNISTIQYFRCQTFGNVR